MALPHVVPLFPPPPPPPPQLEVQGVAVGVSVGVGAVLAVGIGVPEAVRGGSSGLWHGAAGLTVGWCRSEGGSGEGGVWASPWASSPSPPLTPTTDRLRDSAIHPFLRGAGARPRLPRPHCSRGDAAQQCAAPSRYFCPHGADGEHSCPLHHEHR